MIIGKTNVPELRSGRSPRPPPSASRATRGTRQRAPGGSSGGSAAAVAAGLVGAALASDGAGSIRIPARLVRAVRAQAPARARAAGAARAPLARPVGQRRAHTARGRHRAVPRPRLGRQRGRHRQRARARGPFAQSAATRARAACGSPTPRACRPASSRKPRRRRRAARWTTRSSCCARSATRSPSTTPTTGPAPVPALAVRYLRGAHDDAARGRASGAPGTAHARDGAPGRAGPARAARALARRRGRARAAPERASSSDHDVLLTPATATPPPRIGQLQGRGALWTLNTVAGMVPYNGVWNVTGQPAASVPARLRRRRAAARRADRGARQRRGHAAVAGRADRGRAPVGASSARPGFS